MTIFTLSPPLFITKADMMAVDLDLDDFDLEALRLEERREVLLDFASRPIE